MGALTLKWNERHIEVTPTKWPKKITGTRLAAIMGLNKWNTPFKTWCEITKTYAEPFEDTKYTLAGKVIEPKQAEYMRTAYAMTDIKTPTDVFGPDYFNRTHGDFFPHSEIFGGMWDYLLTDANGRPTTVLEMKTTQRSEDWQDDVPEYYALQAALYAYLLGVDDVVMVCSFLGPKDYDHPEQFVPSVRNTITVPFKVSERYPQFETTIRMAQEWWRNFVQTGISPDFDEKADAEILKALRTNTLAPDADIGALMKEAEDLKAELDARAAQMAEKDARLKTIMDQLKQYAEGQFRDGDKKVELPGSRYVWTVSRSETTTIDKDRLKADGLLEAYQKKAPSYRLTVTEKKED